MNQQQGIFSAIRSLLRILRGKPNIPPTLSANPLLQTILERRSVRSFSGKEIPEDVFAAILEAGRLAPSTVNLQTWSFCVLDGDLWQEIFSRPIPFRGKQAVIILTDMYRSRQVLDVFPSVPLVEHTVAVMNASLAAMNMNVAAEALGVSSVMLSETGASGLLDARYLKEKLALPPHTIPLMTLVFGYAKLHLPLMPPKLPLEAVCFRGTYQPTPPPILQDWLSQMTAGYNASHPGSSFETQLGVYQKKLVKAESDLQEMIYRPDTG